MEKGRIGGKEDGERENGMRAGREEGGRREGGFLTTADDGGVIAVTGAEEAKESSTGRGTVDQFSLVASTLHSLEEDPSLTWSKCSRRTDS